MFDDMPERQGILEQRRETESPKLIGYYKVVIGETL